MRWLLLIGNALSKGIASALIALFGVIMVSRIVRIDMHACVVIVAASFVLGTIIGLGMFKRF